MNFFKLKRKLCSERVQHTQDNIKPAGGTPIISMKLLNQKQTEKKYLWVILQKDEGTY